MLNYKGITIAGKVQSIDKENAAIVITTVRKGEFGDNSIIRERWVCKTTPETIDRAEKLNIAEALVVGVPTYAGNSLVIDAKRIDIVAGAHKKTNDTEHA